MLYILLGIFERNKVIYKRLRLLVGTNIYHTRINLSSYYMIEL